MNTTDTPRTDAAEIVQIFVNHPELRTNRVPADFARELERENQTLRNAQKACEDCAAPTVGRIERALADSLGALLQRHRDGYGGQQVDPECDCHDCEYLGPIDEALAAWKGARHE